MMVLGGIRAANVPATAKVPRLNGRESFLFSMTGMATEPMVAAAAVLLPLMNPKIAHTTVEDMAKPPGRAPNHLYRPSNRSSPIRWVVNKLPIKINIGMARSEEHTSELQ